MRSSQAAHGPSPSASNTSAPETLPFPGTTPSTNDDHHAITHSESSRSLATGDAKRHDENPEKTRSAQDVEHPEQGGEEVNNAQSLALRSAHAFASAPAPVHVTTRSFYAPPSLEKSRPHTTTITSPRAPSASDNDFWQSRIVDLHSSHILGPAHGECLTEREGEIKERQREIERERERVCVCMCIYVCLPMVSV